MKDEVDLNLVTGEKPQHFQMEYFFEVIEKMFTLAHLNYLMKIINYQIFKFNKGKTTAIVFGNEDNFNIFVTRR